LDIIEENPLSVNNVEIRFEIMGRMRNRYRQFIEWWLGLMQEEEGSSIEKLALFWSTVWCIEFTYDTLSLVPPQLLYKNNQLLRTRRLGNYRDFVLDMTLDGAMLLYQSMHYSSINAPNENYPREMLELFTMGIGHYTEGDIQVASELFTGWRTAAFQDIPPINGIYNTYYDPNQHGIGTKGRTFMGVTIPPLDENDLKSEFLVKEKEVKGVIDIMFEQRPMPIGRFISEKIYRYFVYASEGDIDNSMIEDLAEIMVQNDFNVRPVFEALITSKHFYNEGAIGIQFKTPPEFIVGFAKQLGIEYDGARQACNDLEQVLYDPPNVGSWKGYRTWLSTTTLPLRIKYANEILDEASNENLTNLVKEFTDYTDLNKINIALLEYFLGKIPNQTRIDRYKSIMTNIVSEANWSNEIENNTTNAANAIRDLISEVIKSPDFQLC
jgi:uncharacterized protein (DUF1800 family)